MRALKIICYILVLIGALNWGLVGIFNYNLVSAIFGDMTFMTRLIYILVGVASIISVITTYRDVADEY